ncbi:hypothetical protein V1512DRAFT_264196 [Lipomyces arxii]|uniref:uncharacterized protein n=1 Tax=Lipomyces arxii TaxID=56418 RepID=UPI0034CFD378
MIPTLRYKDKQKKPSRANSQRQATRPSGGGPAQPQFPSQADEVMSTAAARTAFQHSILSRSSSTRTSRPSENSLSRSKSVPARHAVQAAPSTSTLRYHLATHDAPPLSSGIVASGVRKIFSFGTSQQPQATSLRARKPFIPEYAPGPVLSDATNLHSRSASYATVRPLVIKPLSVSTSVSAPVSLNTHAMYTTIKRKLTRVRNLTLRVLHPDKLSTSTSSVSSMSSVSSPTASRFRQETGFFPYYGTAATRQPTRENVDKPDDTILFRPSSTDSASRTEFDSNW